jgi:hypothetical protein
LKSAIAQQQKTIEFLTALAAKAGGTNPKSERTARFNTALLAMKIFIPALGRFSSHFLAGHEVTTVHADVRRNRSR